MLALVRCTPMAVIGNEKTNLYVSKDGLQRANDGSQHRKDGLQRANDGSQHRKDGLHVSDDHSRHYPKHSHPYPVYLSTFSPSYFPRGADRYVTRH